LLDTHKRIEHDDEGRITRVWLSAQNGEGLELLRDALSGFFRTEMVGGWLELPAHAGRLRARLFAIGAVIQEKFDDYGVCRLKVYLPRRIYRELVKQEGLPEAIPIS